MKKIVSFLVVLGVGSFAFAEENTTTEVPTKASVAAPASDTSSTYNSRKGFFIGFGVGGGGFYANDNAPGSFSNGAVALNFRLGGGINEKILLMYEGFGGGTEDGNIEYYLGSSNFSVQIFPVANFYVRPGIGFAVVRARTDAFGFNVSADSDVGLSLVGALGYDFRLGRSFALAPEFHASYARIEGADIFTYAAILGFSWYFKGP